MSDDKTETTTQTPPTVVWGRPWIVVHWWEPLAVIEYDLAITRDRFSSRAVASLKEYFDSYWRANGIVKSVRDHEQVEAVFGMVDIHPTHAKEIAFRLLLFMFDVENHDAEFRRLVRSAQRHVGVDPDFVEMDWAVIRPKLAKEFPEYANDPLGEFPTPPEGPARDPGLAHQKPPAGVPQEAGGLCAIILDTRRDD